jgi:hypothetical protein
MKTAPHSGHEHLHQQGPATHRDDDRSTSAFPRSAIGGPAFEPIDLVGLAAAILIALGPLAAYSLGLGA